MAYFRLIIFCCFACIAVQCADAQQGKLPLAFNNSLKEFYPDSMARIQVGSVSIAGNKKTKNYIILREMPFKSGDSLVVGNIAASLEQAGVQIHNTNLFQEISVIPVMNSSRNMEVVITVREKWYLYPVPQFKLADRNFNEWVKTHNADFSRVVYGIKFAHYNFTGRADQLRIYLLNGYARNLSFSYSAPYSNSKLSEGFRVSAGYTQNREVAYETTYKDSLLFYKKEGFVADNFFASVSYQSRRGFFKRHIYSISYSYISVDDSIIHPKYNPNYFNSPNSTRGFPDLSYSFQYANTNNVNYPLKGTVYGFTILKRGLEWKGSINMLSIEGAYIRYMSHFNNRLYSSIQVYGKLKLPFTQAYINRRALGYGDVYLRGLEYYVIDGVAAALARYTIKKKLISFNIPVPFHIKALPKIPFTFFAKTYADFGYSYNQKEYEARLNNRLLYTGGFGLDLLTVYGVNIYVEYSFNQLGENGLFLHGKSGF